MGNTQTKALQASIIQGKIDANQVRYIQQSQECEQGEQNNQLIEILPFKIIDFQQIVKDEQDEQDEQDETENNQKCFKIYFKTTHQLESYISNIIRLKQFCKIKLYENYQIMIEKEPFFIKCYQNKGSKIAKLDKQELKQSLSKMIDLFIFVCRIMEKTTNMYIEPSFIYESNDKFYLTMIQQRTYSKKDLILGFISWIYENDDDFQMGIQNQNMMPSMKELSMYMRQIYQSLQKDKINPQNLLNYFTKIKDKMEFLNQDMDSFQACLAFNKTRNWKNQKEWILSKRNNQIFFYCIKDNHSCLGKIVRKKNKIKIENAKLIFDKNELEVKFLLENTKNIVKTSDFQLQDNFSLSDIQIKHKLPVKFRNPCIFMDQQTQQIYLFEYMVYKFDPLDNKLCQLTNRINDCIFFAPNQMNRFILIRLSIDIFRNGLRIYYNNQYLTLMPSCNTKFAEQLQSLKIDIKNVEFCEEVFRGVYVMMANRNFWILDLNFMCFFSYTSTLRLKQFYKNNKGKIDESTDYLFEILDQPFSVKFLTNHDGINISIMKDHLHIIGLVNGRFYYLEYLFIAEIGAIKLLRYRPLIQDRMQKIQEQREKSICEKSEFNFNIYNQNLEYYKSNIWVYEGAIFLNIFNFNVSTTKSGYQFLIETEQVSTNLKDCIVLSKKLNKQWSNQQKTSILLKILTLFETMWRAGISHKNFSLGNIFITQQRQIKMVSWSQPQRNWHISDFKDFILTCFNVISHSTYDKLIDKNTSKHENQLNVFPIFKEKIAQAMKNKVVEKKSQIEKSLTSLKDSLYHQILSKVVEYRQNKYIFSFQNNTPKFSIVYIPQSKIKKYKAVIENNEQQFIFKNTDKFTWNQQKSLLTIFTSCYKTYQTKIKLEEFNEDNRQENKEPKKIILEEFEYLPNNIVESSFVVCGDQIYSFGGYYKDKKKRVSMNLDVYKFNREKLTWQSVAKLQESRLNPKLVVSSCKKLIYVIGGQTILKNNYLKLFAFNTKNNEIHYYLDKGITKLLQNYYTKYSTIIFDIAGLESTFMVWNISNFSFHFKLFSTEVCGFQIDLQSKIYLEDSNLEMQDISISLYEGVLHFLRPYGKYTKIKLDKLNVTNTTHKTLYGNN